MPWPVPDRGHRAEWGPGVVEFTYTGGQSGSATSGDRVAASNPGHHQRMSLSPVSAIGDMVAPVVLITLTTIFSNGLTAVGTGLGRDVLAMERERMSILRGPHGE